MTARDDEELAALLSDLETTLRDLRDELDDDGQRRRRGDTDRSSRENRRGDRSDDRSGTRRDGDSRDGLRRSDERDREPAFDPPSVGDILRFTEQYTLPTLIATLEATIEALELFRRILGVATPGDTDRRVSQRGDQQSGNVLDDALSGAGRQASDQLADRLDDLRTALSETDLPADDDAQTIISDARELTDEIEARVRDADSARSDTRRNENRSRDRDDTRRDGSDTENDHAPADGADDGPVTIEVGGPDDGSDSDDDSTDAADGSTEDQDTDDPPEVDVDAELESIKREMGDDEKGEEEVSDGNADADTEDESDDSADGSTDE